MGDKVYGNSGGRPTLQELTASGISLVDAGGYYQSENLEDFASELYGRCDVNYCINSNFDIWQRGTSFTNPFSGAYTADRVNFRFSADGGTPPTIVHSRQTLISGELDKSFYFYRINSNGAGSGYGVNSFYITALQQIENGVRLLCGIDKKVTISFYIKSDIAGRVIALEPAQHYGSGGSPSSTEYLTTLRITCNSIWTKVTHTFTTNTLTGKTFGTNNDDRLEFIIFSQAGSGYNSRTGGSPIAWASGNVDIAQVQINAGDTALDYIAPIPAEEELRCMRYYEKSCNIDVYPAVFFASYTAYGCNAIANYTTTLIINAEKFKVSKRIVPTMAMYGGEGSTGGLNYSRDQTVGGAVYMGNSPAFNWTTKKDAGCFISTGTGATALVAGHYYGFYWTADAEF